MIPLEHRIEAVAADRNTVIWIARERGTQRATGAEYDLQLTMAVQFRDGRVAGCREYATPLR